MSKKTLFCRKPSFWFCALMTASVFSFLMTPLAAQALENKAFQSWVGGCTDQQTCVAFAQLNTDGGKEMLHMALIFPEGASEGQLQIRTPLGTALKAGMVMKLGVEGRENTALFTMCTEEGCIVRIPLTQSNLRKLRSAQSFEVRFIYGKPLSVPVQLSGLDDALKYVGR